MSFKQHEDQQLRVDPGDGKAYPLDSFLEVYGEAEDIVVGPLLASSLPTQVFLC